MCIAKRGEICKGSIPGMPDVDAFSKTVCSGFYGFLYQKFVGIHLEHVFKSYPGVYDLCQES